MIEKPKKILVIDDDIWVREMLRDLLESEGYDVETAANGSDGLKLYENTNFDLIITDIIMPEKEGIETIYEIRKKDNSIPIIAMSGGGRLGPGNYLEIAKAIGANFVFMKPFLGEEFLNAVRTSVGC